MLVFDDFMQGIAQVADCIQPLMRTRPRIAATAHAA